MAQSGHAEAFGRMSAFGGKADIDSGIASCPLLTQSGYYLHRNSAPQRAPDRPALMRYTATHPWLGPKVHFDRLNRREFITLLGGAAAWPLAARAQRQALPVVGHLDLLPGPEGRPHLFAAIRKGLNETGY